MRRALTFVVVVSLGLSGSAVAAHRHPSTGIIPKFVGSVDASNAARFLKSVIGQTDKIVGLKISIEPSTNADFKDRGYLALKDDRLFSVSVSPPGEPGESGGLEMVAPKDDVDWLHGSYVLDGFYVVKSGGMHQGTASVGLEKADEAAVLLSPKFRVVTRAVR